MAKKIVDENGEIMYLNDDFDDGEFPEIEELNDEVAEKILNPQRRCQQVQGRVKQLTLPVDKLSCCLWNYTDAEFADIVNNRRQCGCIEDLVKGKEIVTPYFLSLVEPYVDLSPLTPFHREVLFHAINLFASGYNLITISMTLDSMTGGVENRNLKRNTARFEAIKSAIDKLAHTAITVDLKPLLTNFPKYRRRHTRDKFQLTDVLLPCRYLDAQVNGQKTLAIELRGESPLVYIAGLKNQFLRYNTEPLAIAGQKNTVQTITIKNFLLRRIELMKKRRLARSIVFTTLYKECGLADASDSVKQNARKEVTETLEAFKAAGVIKDFAFERKAGKYRAIKITLEQSP